MRTNRVVTSWLISVAVAGVCFCSLASVDAQQAPDLGMRIARLLDPIRRNYTLPALGGAIVTSQGLIGVGVTGVRKAGTDALVTPDDKWHLGSDTKAMTATMIGLLVQQGKLRWDSTIGEVFTDLASNSRSPLTKVTLLQLLSHRAGLPSNPSGGWDKIPRNVPIRRQREIAVETALKMNNAKPGTAYEYSNWGYVIAGAMAERAADATWEDLMTSLVFKPLGMTSVGFGGMGTPGVIDQPWGHTDINKPVSGNGPDVDNPPVLGPAGRVHATLSDWSKFIADQLRGARREQALLNADTYTTLHTPPFEGDYALGWATMNRDWGGGTVLTHTGSNTMHYAVAWMAPLRDFAVLIVTNEGGNGVDRAVDEAAQALIWLQSSVPR
jgi:CubicO group peptidase (beta-lactamase class C family)